MNRSNSLSRRIKEVLLDGHWVANTNFKDLIQGVTWIQASEKTRNLNSIAEITFHINYYLGGILNVFKGGKLEIRDKYSFDLAPINSEADWNRLVEDFISNSNDFVLHVKAMSDEKLNSTFVDENYGTYQRNIEGVIEHSYYHLGQIVLIKKIITN
ncbi:DinB family protein [Allomuricauda sp. R78024]|uniref:DinB family protein n=1 Tax=Allomuricauda sp. R78024 TaxID=3093867 RepID=UPI0037C7A5BC